MISRDELIELLNSLEVKVNEGQSTQVNLDYNPRIVFYDFVWDSQAASGTNYNDVVTYQIDFYSNITRHPKLLELKNKLLNKGYKPQFYHEYVNNGIDQSFYHSYFSVDILENLNE